MLSIFKTITVFFVFYSLASCAIAPKQTLVYNQNAVIESLSTGVSLSLHTPDRSMSGNGFMVYRRPDKIHMILLSPFGTTLFEVFALGNQITLVYPAQGVAYSGHFSQLPKKGGSQGWSLMQWIMDADPIGPSKANGTYERLNKQGLSEKITTENGLIVMKTNPEGDHVYYGEYSVVNGVPIAAEIDIRNKQDDRIRLKLQDTEINVSLADAAFMPRLEGFKIFPLSELNI